jgi:gluconokinase
MAQNASEDLPLIVVMGVAGSGKTTIASGLAKRLEVAFIEGDALHPHSNVEKMAGGIPLTDEDRWPWLRAIGTTMESERREGHGVVVSCSALKHIYRDCIRSMVHGPVRFILLNGPRDLIALRMAGRKGHFMPPALLESQFATLEPPGADEDAVTLDITGTVEQLIDQAYAAARARRGQAGQAENRR